MARHRIATSLVLIPFLTSAACAGAMPRGSFLKKPVHTSTQLVRMLNNPVVAHRYAKLYGIHAQEVRTRFSDLRLARLPKDQILRVYYIKNEKPGYRLRKLRKGTSVFLDSHNEPALVRICGNPLAKPPRTAKKLAAPIFQAEEPDTPLEYEGPISPPELRLISPPVFLSVDMPAPEIEERQDLLPPPQTTTREYPLYPPELPESFPAPSNVFLAGGSRLSPFWWALLPSSFFALDRHHSGSTESHPLTPPAIPETSGLAAGSGLIFLLGLHLRTRKRKQPAV